MADYKLVNIELLENNLTSIADNIREKTGVAGELGFPDGFNQSLRGIQTVKDWLLKISDYQYLFADSRLSEFIGKIDTSHVYNFKGAFMQNMYLTNIDILDTSRALVFTDMFFGCSSLASIPPLDISKGHSFGKMFYGCNQLTTITLTTTNYDLATDTFYQCNSLTNLSVGENWHSSIYLTPATALTQESLHGIIENLADLTGSTAKNFTVGTTNLEKIDESHIAMLEAKNWIYS